MLVGLLIVVVLVLANGFFVASEFALAHLDACQLGITIASIGRGGVGEPAAPCSLRAACPSSTRIAGSTLPSG